MARRGRVVVVSDGTSTTRRVYCVGAAVAQAGDRRITVACRLRLAKRVDCSDHRRVLDGMPWHLMANAFFIDPPFSLPLGALGALGALALAWGRLARRARRGPPRSSKTPVGGIFRRSVHLRLVGDQHAKRSGFHWCSLPDREGFIVKSSGGGPRGPTEISGGASRAELYGRYQASQGMDELRRGGFFFFPSFLFLLPNFDSGPFQLVAPRS